MKCPLCGEARSPLAFMFEHFFTPMDRKLQAFCPTCADAVWKAAKGRAETTPYTVSQCIDKLVAAVNNAFKEAE